MDKKRFQPINLPAELLEKLKFWRQAYMLAYGENITYQEMIEKLLASIDKVDPKVVKAMNAIIKENPEKASLINLDNKEKPLMDLFAGEPCTYGDSFELKHRETLKRIFRLVEKRNYGRKWIKEIYDYTDTYELQLIKDYRSNEDFVTTPDSDHFELARFWEDSDNVMYSAETPKYGTKGFKLFVKAAFLAMLPEYPFWERMEETGNKERDERDLDAHIITSKFLSDDPHIIDYDFEEIDTAWEKYIKPFLYVFEKLDDEEIYDENDEFNLDLFCERTGLAKEDIDHFDEDNDRVYLKHSAIEKFEAKQNGYAFPSKEWEEEWELTNDHGLANKKDGYVISSREIIDNRNLLTDIAKKGKYDLNKFCYAYERACMYNNVKHLIIDVDTDWLATDKNDLYAGEWKIYDTGISHHIEPAEGFFIDAKTLKTDEFFLFDLFTRKRWVDMNTFFPAVLLALKRYNVKKKKINTF